MKLTKRGKRVRAVGIIIGLYAIYQITGHIWYVGPGFPTEDLLGYCFDTMIECTLP